jgi:TusE/DsrC/DsvC family sulfur relay protein
MGLSIWSLAMIGPRPGFDLKTGPRDSPDQPKKREGERMSYQVNGHTIEHDEEGYITSLNDWSEELARVIAESEKIDMTDEHWAVINFLRNYYEEYQIAPAVRVLIKAIKKELGPDVGNNKYMYELFPYGPAKQACKIAGLPKPTGCV